MQPEFIAWPKIPRLNRSIIVTEKLDGTNAAVIVTEDGGVYAQSRKRLITPAADNFGFAAWVQEHADELRELGPGHHYGEWYGLGIQRGYGLDHRRFALFNTARWCDERPACCDVVPAIGGCTTLDDAHIRACVGNLRTFGSAAVPGFMRPEGVVVWHTAARQGFKVLLEGDELPKGGGGGVTPNQQQALEVCAEAIARAESRGLPEDGVAFTLIAPTGVLTRTLAEVRAEHAALSLRHLDFPVDMDPR
jgi:hypothetical protein